MASDYPTTNPQDEDQPVPDKKTAEIQALLARGDFKGAVSRLDNREALLLDYLVTEADKGKSPNLMEALKSVGMELSDIMGHGSQNAFQIFNTYLEQKGMGVFQIINARIKQSKAKKVIRTVRRNEDGMSYEAIEKTRFPDWKARSEGLAALERMTGVIPQPGRGNVNLGVFVGEKGKRRSQLEDRNLVDEIISDIGGIHALEGIEDDGEELAEAEPPTPEEVEKMVDGDEEGRDE